MKYLKQNKQSKDCFFCYNIIGDFMELNEKEIDLILGDLNSNMHNNIHNDIYLSDKQVALLQAYNIDYKSFNNLESLIFYIDNVLGSVDDSELEMLLDELSEFNYYNNTNK